MQEDGEFRVINVDGVRGSALRAAIQSIYAREVSSVLISCCVHLTRCTECHAARWEMPTYEHQMWTMWCRRWPSTGAMWRRYLLWSNYPIVRLSGWKCVQCRQCVPEQDPEPQPANSEAPSPFLQVLDLSEKVKIGAAPAHDIHSLC